MDGILHKWTHARKGQLQGMADIAGSEGSIRKKNEKLASKGLPPICFDNLLEIDYNNKDAKKPLILNPRIIRNLHHFFTVFRETDQPITSRELLREIGGRSVIEWICQDKKDLLSRLQAIFNRDAWDDKRAQLDAIVVKIPNDMLEALGSLIKVKGQTILGGRPFPIDETLDVSRLTQALPVAYLDGHNLVRLMPSCLRQLLQNNALPTAEDWQTPLPTGETFRHYAVRYGNLDLVLDLMDRAGQPVDRDFLQDLSGDNIHLLEHALDRGEPAFKALYLSPRWAGKTQQLQAALDMVPASFAEAKTAFMRAHHPLRQAALRSLREPMKPAPLLGDRGIESIADDLLRERAERLHSSDRGAA